MKTDLTPEERIAAAYLSVVRNVPHQDLAVAFGVNMGRISEAVVAIRLTADDPKGAREKIEEKDAA